MKKTFFQVEVETYDGMKGAERPRAFVWKEKRIECTEILDRWYGEDHEYFKVSGDDGRVYVLRYDRKEDRWEISIVQGDGANPS